MDGARRTIMLTRYYDPILSTAFDLFPDYVWTSSNKRSDTIDKNGIKVELPGVKSCDLEVTVEGKQLHVNGKNRHGKNFNYVYSISGNVNADKISAKFYDGLLEIELPKKEDISSKRRIEIQT